MRKQKTIAQLAMSYSMKWIAHLSTVSQFDARMLMRMAWIAGYAAGRKRR